jgi:hypothetical protein
MADMAQARAMVGRWPWSMDGAIDDAARWRENGRAKMARGKL